MEKTEWPTEKRLDELRQEGEAPCSRGAEVCFSAAAVVVAVLLLRGVWSDLLEYYSRLWSLRAVSLPDPGDLFGAKNIFLRLLLIPVIAAAIAGIVTTLAQTRFLFQFGRIRLDLGRLHGFRRFRFWRISARFVFAPLFLIFFFAVAVGAALLSMRSMLNLLNHDREFALNWLQESTLVLLPLLLSILIGIGSTFWFTERWLFRRRHRMTRQEIEEEQVG